jgi:hypothetical protein
MRELILAIILPALLTATEIRKDKSGKCWILKQARKSSSVESIGRIKCPKDLKRVKPITFVVD